MRLNGGLIVRVYFISNGGNVVPADTMQDPPEEFYLPVLRAKPTSVPFVGVSLMQLRSPAVEWESTPERHYRCLLACPVLYSHEWCDSYAREHWRDLLTIGSIGRHAQAALTT